ncbi:protein-L-isoaspartate O-methyltransferase, partial [Durotheca rogersii]|uniref:protein-L-isoaspartate O-methyltransferase n=1 Tax=Durotheca rogersii TaxID=419775 RepID=UPI0022204C20
RANIYLNLSKVSPELARLSRLAALLPARARPIYHRRFSGGSRPIFSMPWRSSGRSNAELVENLWRNELITSPRVKEAFLSVDRAHYAPADPYADSPQPIGHKATISAPHMHAQAVETLLPFVLPVGGGGAAGAGGAPGKTIGLAGRPRRVLDIGSGSGYLTHVLAELAGADGVVVGLEHIPALKELGERNMAKSAEGRRLLASGRARFRVGDGRRGWSEPKPAADIPGVGGPAAASAAESRQMRGDAAAAAAAAAAAGAGATAEDEGGWDAIHVGAAAAELHDELVRQLRSPGRMFIPVAEDNGWEQYIWTVDKDEDGKVRRQRLYGVRYVPLTDAPAAGKAE